MREVGSPTIIVHRCAGSPEETARNREKVRMTLESTLEKQSGCRIRIKILWMKKLAAEDKTSADQ